MAKLGILPAQSGHVRPGGQGCWTRCTSPARTGCGSSRCVTCWRSTTGRSPWSSGRSTAELKDHPGYRAIQAMHGVGPITAAIFVAEIGDVHPFPHRPALCSWAGMTPKLHESDTKSSPGPDHQAGLDHRTLGGGRVRGPLPRRRADRPRLQTYRRAARERSSPGWRRPENCSRWSTTGCETARSAAWPGRPLEQARTQPGRELDHRRGPPSVAWPSYLNEPVWLWPEHTMRTSAKEWPVAEHLGRPAQDERNGEVRCVQPPQQPGPPNGRSEPMVAGDN